MTTLSPGGVWTVTDEGSDEVIQSPCWAVEKEEQRPTSATVTDKGW